jgi:tripartite-type tricarboxylate transporter receptor subunit TctC
MHNIFFRARSITAIVVTSLTAAFAVPALAQEKFPSKPVTIVVPYEPGGGGDVYSRLLQPFLAKELGVSVVVENIAGAGGIVGQNSAFARPADGYTIVLWSTPSNELNAITTSTPFEVEDWTALGFAAPGQTIVAVPADRPWNNLKQLVDDLRATPRKFTIGGIGPFGTGGIAYVSMAKLLKFDARWVPFEGTNDVTTALLGGHIDVALVGGSEQRYVDLMKSGKMKILGVLSDKAAGPYATANIATAQAQLGVRIFHEVNRGHVVRTNTPADRMRVLRDAYQKAATNPEFVAQVQKRVGPYAWSDGPSMTTILHSGTKDLRSLLPALNAMAGKK